MDPADQHMQAMEQRAIGNGVPLGCPQRMRRVFVHLEHMAFF